MNLETSKLSKTNQTKKVETHVISLYVDMDNSLMIARRKGERRDVTKEC